jgi:hypothetical protein
MANPATIPNNRFMPASSVRGKLARSPRERNAGTQSPKAFGIVEEFVSDYTPQHGKENEYSESPHLFDRFFDRSGKVIIPLTVREILDEEIVRKSA